MTSLLAAALFLPISHYGLSSTRLRDVLVGAIGERGYQGLYSLIAFGAFYWLISAYRAAPLEVLWVAPQALKLATVPIVFLAFFLVVVGVTTPNPTAVGAEALFRRPDLVRGILRVTRNPFLWGASLWAFAHLLVGGDVASLYLFGSIAVLGGVGTMLLEAKKARRHGADWARFSGATSSVPFLAIFQRRQKFDVAEMGWWRVALAVGLFLVVLFGHRWAFGVSPLPA